MRTLMLIAAVALAASCTRPAALPGSNFAAETAGRIPGRPQSCVSTSPAENLHVLDAGTVAYGYGRTIYVNRLRSACPAMSQFNTIIVQPSVGGEYCRGDLVRGLEPGAIIPGPTCILGDWVPYRTP